MAMGRALLVLAFLILTGCGKAMDVSEYEREHAVAEREMEPALDPAASDRK